MEDSFFECRNATWKSGHVKEYFWISGVMLVSVGVLGVVGNVLNLLVLLQKEFRGQVFYNLLVALACFDIMFILSYSTSVGYQSLACNPFNLTIRYVTYPIINISLTGSVYMTIAISAERYIGVCYPIHYSQVRRTTKSYILSVVAISLVYNFPRFLERTFTVENGTFNDSYRDWAKTTLYKDIYHLWASILVITVIPITMVLSLNGAIIVRLYRSSNLLAHCRYDQDKPYGNSTRILLGIVFLFLTCFTPRVVYKCFYYLSSSDRDDWYSVSPVYKFGLVLNSSANFILYCLIGTDFRIVFLRVLSFS